MEESSTSKIIYIKCLRVLLPLFFIIQGALAQCPPKVTVYSPYPAPGVTYPAATANLKNVFNVIPKTSVSVSYTHTFTFQALGDFTIKFGDGTPDYVYTGAPITTVSHTYSTQGLFEYEIINNVCGSSVRGKIYNAKDTEPMILGAGFPPTDNYCVPNGLTFQNNSLGMSPFFEYDWDFGDTPAAAYDTTLTVNNGIGTISHTYSKAYSKCGIYVKFRIRKILPGNDFVPFIQTGGPYNFLNLDVPKVNRQEVILCQSGSAQDVELADASVLNCLASGQRTIRWDIVGAPSGKPLSTVSGTLGSEGSYAVAANKKIRVKVPATAVTGDEYKVQLIINNQCGKDTSYAFIKVVSPSKPTYTASGSSVCPGKKLTFKNTSPDRTNPQYDYYWDVYDEAGVKKSTLQSDNENVDLTFNFPGIYKVVLRSRITGYSITAPAPICENLSDAQTITVNQNVVALIQLSEDTLCVKPGTPALVQFKNISLNETSTTQYRWFVSPAGGDTLTFGNTPLSLLRETSFTPTTHGRYIVKLEASDAVNTCTKTLGLDTFFIFNQPKPLIKATNVCAGVEVILRDSSKVFDTANKGFPANVDNLKVTVDFRDGSPLYSYLKNDNGTCGNGTNLYTTNKIACTRLTKHIFKNPGEYWVKFTIQNPEASSYYCQVIDSVLVKVWPVPSPSFTKTANGCAPLKTSLSNTTLENPDHLYVWNINGDDLKPKSAPASLDTVFEYPGEYKIILKAVTPNGCITATAPQTVKVFSVPQFQVTSNYSTFASKCGPLNLKFSTDLATSALPSIDSAIWSFYDENHWIGGDTIAKVTAKEQLEVSKSFVNISFVQKKFKAKLSVKFKDGSCTSEKETEFVINPRPVVDFTIDKAEGCSPLSVQFKIDPSNIDPSTQYIWNFPGGSLLTSNSPEPPAITFVNKGSTPVTSTVRLTTMSQQGCSDFIEKTITIYPETLPKFAIINNKKLCNGEALKFENKSTGAIASRYVWIWGDGTENDTTSSASGFVYHKFENKSFLNDTTYEVRLLAVTNCVVQSDLRTVTVERGLKPDFNISSSTNCSPTQILLTSVSEGPVSGLTWKINGEKLDKKTGTVIHNLSNTTNEKNEFTITLIVKSNSGCTDSLSQTITIEPAITTAFDYKNINATNCSPTSYEFINNSAGPARYYVWDFGDGTKDTVTSKEAASHTFVNPGTSQVVYRVVLTSFTDGACGNSKYTDIIVVPSAIPDFTADSVGCSPFEVKFENRSVKADILEWDFDNGMVYSGIKPPNQVYFNTTNKPIVKEIKLKAISSGGCENLVVKKVTIYPAPKPSFKIGEQTMKFPATTAVLQNTSPEGDWNYEWNFGDGETSTEKDPKSHKYKKPGNYNITLKVSNGVCEKSFTSGFKIIPEDPVANFKQDVTKGCRPLVVHFENLSEYADPSKYVWEFGDGLGRSQSADPVYTYYEPGVYSVKLHAVNAEGKSDEIIKEQLIEVSEVPYATFKQSRNVVHIPSEEIYFTNLSENAKSYFWDFGDGNFSYDKNPVYTYTDTGRFTITMIAISENGCADTTSLEKAVLATADGTIKVPNAFTPSLIGSNSRNVSSEGLNDVFKPIVEGVKEIEVQVFNRWGEVVYSFKGESCEGWNGYYKGKLCKQDVYIYSIKARLANGEVIEKVGDVMLLN